MLEADTNVDRKTNGDEDFDVSLSLSGRTGVSNSETASAARSYAISPSLPEPVSPI